MVIYRLLYSSICPLPFSDYRSVYWPVNAATNYTIRSADVECWHARSRYIDHHNNFSTCQPDGLRRATLFSALAAESHHGAHLSQGKFLMSPAWAFRLCASLLAVASASANAQAFAKVDEIFADYALDNHIPGLVYGIVSNGKLIHVRGIGVQDLESKRSVTADTLFRTGKHGKQGKHRSK